MSRKLKVMLAFGTRPEAIKMAPLFHALSSRREFFNPVVCVSGQHRQMLDQVLNTFDIAPEHDLDVMRADQDLFDVTASVLVAMRPVLLHSKPDIVLVHGDTTTAMATSIAAFYAGIPVGHVEAGLRTRNLASPFPEEANRQIVSRIAKYHFAPTEGSRQNLIDEAVSPRDIVVTGNTVIDALHWMLKRIKSDPRRIQELEQNLSTKLRFSWKNKKFVLVTGHRRENFGEGFDQICSALGRASLLFPEVHFVYPVHLNPNVRITVFRELSGRNNVHLIEPLAYEEFVLLLSASFLILTDSGGIQEEAPSLGKPVLVMREVTERPEAVQAGTVSLVGATEETILSGITALLTSSDLYEKMSRSHNPYGDGNACERISDFLQLSLGSSLASE